MEIDSPLSLFNSLQFTADLHHAKFFKEKVQQLNENPGGPIGRARVWVALLAVIQGTIKDPSLTEIIKGLERTFEEVKTVIEGKDREIEQLLETTKGLETEVKVMRIECDHLKSEGAREAQTEKRAFNQKRASLCDLRDTLESSRLSRISVPPSPSSKKQLKSLNLKQLREKIENIYTSKAKFDMKCAATMQPRKTMDEFLAIYLNQKYGLKSLINQVYSLISSAVERYREVDAEVYLFRKTLSNEINEEFRNQLSSTENRLKTAIERAIRGAWPFRKASEIRHLVVQKLSGFLNFEECKALTGAVFSAEDARLALNQIVEALNNKQCTTKNNRKSYMYSPPRLPYAEFLNIILRTEITVYEVTLSPFYKRFVLVDQDADGILSELEFISLVNSLGLLDNAEKLLDRVDPKGFGAITFSDVVSLKTGSPPVSVIHSLSNQLVFN